MASVLYPKKTDIYQRTNDYIIISCKTCHYIHANCQNIEQAWFCRKYRDKVRFL